MSGRLAGKFPEGVYCKERGFPWITRVVPVSWQCTVCDGVGRGCAEICRGQCLPDDKGATTALVCGEPRRAPCSARPVAVSRERPALFGPVLVS